MVDAIISCGSHTTGILVGETLLMLGGFMTLQMRVHKKLVRNCSCEAKSSQVKSSQVKPSQRPSSDALFTHVFALSFRCPLLSAPLRGLGLPPPAPGAVAAGLRSLPYLQCVR